MSNFRQFRTYRTFEIFWIFPGLFLDFSSKLPYYTVYIGISDKTPDLLYGLFLSVFIRDHKNPTSYLDQGRPRSYVVSDTRTIIIVWYAMRMKIGHSSNIGHFIGHVFWFLKIQGDSVWTYVRLEKIASIRSSEVKLGQISDINFRNIND